MAKFGGNMQRPKDYVPPQGTGGSGGFGATLEEGEYEVKGIIWAHKDADDQPALKAQKDGRLTARYRFVLVDTEKKVKPYATATLADMSMLMRAFNKEVPLIPVPDEKDAAGVRDFLVYCGKAINESGNTTKIHINAKGYVGWIDGAHIEADREFVLKITRILSKNENNEYSWIHRNFGEGRSAQLIKVQLEIVAGSQGSETPWKGAVFSTDVPYGLTYNEESDEIQFKTNEEGTDDSSRAYAMRKFMYVYCPKALSERLETDYPEDVYNAVPWMMRWAEEDLLFKAEVKNSPGKNGGMWYNINWGKVEPIVEPLLSIIRGGQAAESSATKVSEPAPITQPKPVEKPAESEPVEQVPVNDEDTNESARGLVHGVLNYLGDGEVFAENGGLTDIGKKVANDYLKPLAEKGTIPQTKLTLVTFDEGKDIIKGLLTLFEPGTEQHTTISKHYDSLVSSLLFNDKQEEQLDFDDSDGWA